MAKTSPHERKAPRSRGAACGCAAGGQARARRRRSSGRRTTTRGTATAARLSATSAATMGHAAMYGAEVPAVGGPNDLDALLYPPRAPAVPAGPHPRVLAHGDRRRPRGGARRVLPGLGLQRHGSGTRHPRDRGRSAPRELHERGLPSAHDPLPRDPPDEHGRRLRGRRARRALPVRVRGAAGRLPPLPLPRDAAEEAHPSRPLRRLHHRPEGAAPAGAGARDGDERLRHRRRRRKQLLHRQRALVLLRALPDPGEAVGARTDLPREPHRVRPRQLASPARRLLPLPADRERATTGSTRTR